jgi:hypothetical protein
MRIRLNVRDNPRARIDDHLTDCAFIWPELEMTDRAQLIAGRLGRRELAIRRRIAQEDRRMIAAHQFTSRIQYGGQQRIQIQLGAD